jgi:hypothetical protein
MVLGGPSGIQLVGSTVCGSGGAHLVVAMDG